MKKSRLKKVSRATVVKRLELACEELWKQVCRKRDNDRCRKCGAGREAVLQVHHIESRSYKSTKYDTGNGITLCLAHHKFWAHNPRGNSEYQHWLVNEVGQDHLDYLRKRASEVQFVTFEWLQDIEQGLKEELL